MKNMCIFFYVRVTVPQLCQDLEEGSSAYDHCLLSSHGTQNKVPPPNMSTS